MRALALLLLAAASASAAPDLAPVKKWITQQREVRSIQADFVQTRALRALKSPVTAKGRFWFQAPGSFRWQIGDPPKTIVLGDRTSLLIIQPGKKIAEKSTPDDAGAKARVQGFAMMQLPISADFGEFQRNFEIFSVHTDGTRCELEGLPRDARARRFLAKIVLEFDTRSGHLLSFEAVTHEGSALRSEFLNVVTNGKLPAGIFDYDLGGYHVTDAK